MEKEELEVLEPQHGFWMVEVCIEQEDSDTGKVKKMKEVHLIDGQDPTEVHKKCMEEMQGTMWEWKILSCKQSHINYVY